MTDTYVIAIDGPAASGKGTLARRLADQLNFARLDTGLLYRATGLEVLRQNGDPTDSKTAVAAAHRVAANLSDADYLSDPALRGEATSSAASQVSQHPSVRSALLSIQRDFATNPPGNADGAILDGRDIGTVICPNADIKFYVTAELKERTRRRHTELMNKMDNPPDFERVYAEMAARDNRDKNRETAPLRPANDAIIIDTTNMDIDQVVDEAMATIHAQLPQSMDK